MPLGGAMREPVEVAAQRVRRRAGPVERQQRGGKLRIAQQHAAIRVDQQRAHDERLRGIEVALPACGSDG